MGHSLWDSDRPRIWSASFGGLIEQLHLAQQGFCSDGGLIEAAGIEELVP